MIRILESVDKGIEKVSTFSLIGCVFGMLFFSVLNIVLRWFDTSIHWIDPLVRHLVFLSAFLGGAVATGRGTHIGIDILGKYLESREMVKACSWTRRLISLAAFIVLVWLIKSSLGFMKAELMFGKEVFWGIQSGVLVGIIPFGFCLMAYRFLFRFLASFSSEIQVQQEH